MVVYSNSSRDVWERVLISMLTGPKRFLTPSSSSRDGNRASLILPWRGGRDYSASSSSSSSSSSESSLVSWRFTVGVSLVILCIVGETLNHQERVPDVYKASTIVKTIRRDLLGKIEVWVEELMHQIERLPQQLDAAREWIVSDSKSSHKKRQPLVKHTGSCQCGGVVFQMTAPRTLDIWKKNKPSLLSYFYSSQDSRQDQEDQILDSYPRTCVPLARFHMLQGHDLLRIYADKNRPGMEDREEASAHTFCKICGVYVLYVTHAQGKALFINLHTLQSNWKPGKTRYDDDRQQYEQEEQKQMEEDAQIFAPVQQAPRFRPAATTTPAPTMRPESMSAETYARSNNNNYDSFSRLSGWPATVNPQQPTIPPRPVVPSSAPRMKPFTRLATPPPPVAETSAVDWMADASVLSDPTMDTKTLDTRGGSPVGSNDGTLEDDDDEPVSPTRFPPRPHVPMVPQTVTSPAGSAAGASPHVVLPPTRRRTSGGSNGSTPSMSSQKQLQYYMSKHMKRSPSGRLSTEESTTQPVDSVSAQED